MTGIRNQREKPTSAPYLLLLWTARGQSGINVSLCNHRGTLNLSRRLVLEDIEGYDAEAPAPLVLTLVFDEWDAEICFLTSSDYHSFLELPSRFFAKEQRDLRDPRTGEMAICQSSLISCHDKSRRVSHERPRDVNWKAGRTSSCGLILFETATNSAWETTRRLVVFSPPDPTIQVQIVLQDQDVILKWSDYQQVRRHKTDTREDRPTDPTLSYTYNYDPEHPNRELYLKFINPAAAKKFEVTLLLPTEIPDRVKLLLYERNIQTAQEIRVYQLDGEDSSNIDAFAISLTNKQNIHMTTTRYVYRDLDWILECDATNKITFPRLTAPMYNANPSRMPYAPQINDKAPEFKGVTQGVGALEIETSCQHSISRIMQALTGWKLIANARALKVETPARYGSQTHKGASLQLWQMKSQSSQYLVQLAIRLDEPSTEHWVTAPLPDSLNHAVKRNTLMLTHLKIRRGYEMDSSEMTATAHDEDSKAPAPKSKVVIHFIDAESRGRFMNALLSFSRSW